MSNAVLATPLTVSRNVHCEHDPGQVNEWLTSKTSQQQKFRNILPLRPTSTLQEINRSLVHVSVWKEKQDCLLYFTGFSDLG